MNIITTLLVRIGLVVLLAGPLGGSEVNGVLKLINKERETLRKMYEAGNAAKYIDDAVERRFGSPIMINGNLTLGQYLIGKSLYKERLGKIAPNHLRYVTQLEATDAVIIFVKHLGETRPTFFNALKNNPAKLDEVIDEVHDFCLGSIEDLAAGRNPGRNAGLDGYAIANILGDARKVALPGSSGPIGPDQVSLEEFLELMRRLKGVDGVKSRNFHGRARRETGHFKILDTDSFKSGWKGALYELRCLWRFNDLGDEIIRMRAKVYKSRRDGTKTGELLTDIDIFLRRGGVALAVQAKATYRALHKYGDSVDEAAESFVENCRRMTAHDDIFGPGQVALEDVLPRCKLAMPSGELPGDEFIDAVWKKVRGNDDSVELDNETILSASQFRSWFRSNVIEVIENQPVI